MTETPTPIIKNTVELNEDIPTIVFMRHPRMAGLFFSDATPCELGGSGVPIPEHKELYEKCVKDGTRFYWTTASERVKNIENKNKSS